MGKILDGRVVEYCYLIEINVDTRKDDIILELKYELKDENKRWLANTVEKSVLLAAEDIPSGQTGYTYEQITAALAGSAEAINTKIEEEKKDKSGYEKPKKDKDEDIPSGESGS